MAEDKKSEKPKGENKPIDPMTLATWARLRAAGKIAKPHGAERMDQNPNVKRKKKSKKG